MYSVVSYINSIHICNWQVSVADTGKVAMVSAETSSENSVGASNLFTEYKCCFVSKLSVKAWNGKIQL